MPRNTLHKKCPRCGRSRKWTVPYDHQGPTGYVWEKRDGRWVCFWCVARETPDGEANLRTLHKSLREVRKKVLIFVSGDMFESDADTLVCPVNCVGIMGAGLAAEFKKRSPVMYEAYSLKCRAGGLKPGGLFVWDGDKRIVCLATKNHYSQPSKEEWVVTGLVNLKNWIEEAKPRKLALPALGCGLGKLPWEKVKKLTREILANSSCNILAYEP